MSASAFAATPVKTETPLHIPADRLRLAALITAAGLMGFGLILFIAANWDLLGRFERFGLAGGVMLAGGLAALVRPSLTKPGVLLAFAATGGLLALIGQTYQTGADAWQLFALWAGLTLPWALAARSDAVWTPWAIVALTGVALWHQANDVFDFKLFGPTNAAVAGLSYGNLLAAWGLALGVAASMSAARVLDAALGARRWAFRIAAILALTLIAADTVMAVFGHPNAHVAAYLLGLAFLGGVAFVLWQASRTDMVLVSASALAIDVSLICGFARLVMPNSGGAEFGTFLVTGVVAAAIVAGSVVAIMRLAGRGVVSVASQSRALSARAAVDAVRPWPVVLLSGLGALMAAIPFIVAIGTLFGAAMHKGATVYVVTFLLLPASIYALRSVRGLFAEQLATVALACGLLMLGWGLIRDMPLGWAGFVSSMIAIALALGLGRAWLAALFGAGATVGLAVALLQTFASAFVWGGASYYAIIWSVIALAGVAAAYIMRGNRDWLQPLGAPGTIDETFDTSVDATVAGWVAASLAGLAFASGSTFLMGAHFAGGPGSTVAAFGPIGLSRTVSFMMAAAAGLWLWREMPLLRTPIFGALILTFVALSFAMPSLGATALVLTAALVLRSRAIALAAAVAALWIAGAFYYNLALPLTHKAAILAGTGALLGAFALAYGARLADIAAQASRHAATSPLPMARILAAIGLIATSAVSADAIRSKEALIRDGTPVFIEMAPVDPRSLMQGDYMALRFQLPAGAMRHPPTLGPRPRAIGTHDENGVLRLTRIGDTRTPIDAKEKMIELIHKRGQWIVVTDAWYFKEGTAKKWEAARYGEFRVLPDGRALLVGLADKDRKPIR